MEKISTYGVILTNENVFLADKERHSDMVAKLAEWMGLDGVLITEEGYGNPDTDLMMNCRKVEKKGVKVRSDYRRVPQAKTENPSHLQIPAMKQTHLLPADRETQHYSSR